MPKPSSLPSDLDRLIAARDAALEDAAFLREQLRGAQELLAHVVEHELVPERDERRALVIELARMNAELQERAWIDATGGRLATVSRR